MPTTTTPSTAPALHMPASTPPGRAPVRPSPATGTVARDRRSSTSHEAPEKKIPFVMLLALVALGGIFVVGFPYYAAPMAERVRSPLHPWLRPSGYIGQSAGLLSLAIFIFLWLYPLRKRFRWLSFTGAIAKWLNVHVLAALILPLLVAIHAAWHFDGLIGLGFWSMMVVWASGVVGRYLYAQIPRGKLGVELTREEIVEEKKKLFVLIARRTGLDAQVITDTLSVKAPPPGRLGVWGTLRQIVADDLARRRAARRFRRLCKGRGLSRYDMTRVLERVQREMALTQQARMLDATHDLFRFWHVAHRPVAVAALVAVLIHVVVVVSLGATWLW